MLKTLKLFLLITAAVVGLACVTPFYGTARIEPGWHMDAGVAATSFLGPSASEGEYYGGRGDCELRYGINSYFQTNARIGLGAGYSPPSTEPPDSTNNYRVLFDGAIGFQTAYTNPIITPALRLEAGNGLWLTPVFGIGDKELFTFGSQFVFSFEPQPEFAFLNAFFTVHPWSHISLFAGLMVNNPFFLESPIASLGIGYSIK